MNKPAQFVRRMRLIGIEVELLGNSPWVYISKIDGKKVNETFMGNHGFTLGFLRAEQKEQFKFVDMSIIFKLVRKYKEK